MPVPRPTRPKQDRSNVATGKTLLMEAAARLAARQGATSLVLREIAREAGLNHNTFYRHFADLESMMQAIVEAFGEQLRQGLSDARATLRPGEVPTQKVIGWLFDFARSHRDVFIVAMRERFGPPGPLRDAVQRLLGQLTADTQRDLTMIGYLPDIDPDYIRRLLEVSVNEVFRHCVEYLEEPRRREELLATTQELLETMLAGAAHLRKIETSSRPVSVDPATS
ncbi:MAG: TetR family transcriptional regulator [Polyangiales bacterium]